MTSQKRMFGAGVLLPVAWMILGVMVAPRGLSAQETVYTPDQLSEQPKIASASQARNAILRSYTDDLQSAGIQGKVEVTFVVNADGNVDPATIKVVSTPTQALAKAAEVAVTKIKFSPGMKDGQPVRCQVLMPISYSAGD